jgi:hypothetical protein
VTESGRTSEAHIKHGFGYIFTGGVQYSHQNPPVTNKEDFPQLKGTRTRLSRRGPPAPPGYMAWNLGGVEPLLTSLCLMGRLALRRSLLPCAYCVRLRKRSEFADAMTQGQKRINGKEAHRRFCVDGGLQSGSGLSRYNWGRNRCWYRKRKMVQSVPKGQERGGCTETSRDLQSVP